MTDRTKPIVCEPIDTSEMSSIVVSVSSPLFAVGEANLLDESWAEEFDRRLAAWEAESPSPVPTHDDDEAE